MWRRTNVRTYVHTCEILKALWRLASLGPAKKCSNMDNVKNALRWAHRCSVYYICLNYFYRIQKLTLTTMSIFANSNILFKCSVLQVRSLLLRRELSCSSTQLFPQYRIPAHPSHDLSGIKSNKWWPSVKRLYITSLFKGPIGCPTNNLDNEKEKETWITYNHL